MLSLAPVVVGVSLKMYFGHRRALDWCAAVAGLARERPGIRDGAATVFVLPGFLALPAAVRAFAGTGVVVGAQDLSTEDSGAFTGEVGGPELAEAGADLAAVGHAERRRRFEEDDGVVAAKAAAALRNGLVPVVCVGETRHLGPERAAAQALRQLRAALAAAPAGPVVAAYEPVWAIGAERPAPADHVRVVGRALREHLAADPERAGSGVVYGGTAGPGLLAELAGDVDGLFLGRRAHDPRALGDVVDEALALAAGRRVVAR